ncbi:D-alanine--D-alanyl carrier protein ligase [Pseudoalteromonas holothuriae]|uniref:D-alanine--D-alanyl carrier protein ligase n=1 Tax=Pseudoalteromonas holothuriae TaxID=2963714 RepID=A0ABN8UKF4_9GAMM|nr:AMP-binding protein [Pseudoalteromonas sp. CIP111951]CAH9057861.1 D-alanine--D-alanyl carrier protein ligase [Pseudoalteromonas sp. CIP111951]
MSLTSPGTENAVNSQQAMEQKVYWKSVFNQVTQASRLPHDKYGQFKATDVRADKESYEMTLEQFEPLWNLSKSSDKSLHVLLMAGWTLLLNKYSGLKTLLVGTLGYKEDDAAFAERMLVVRNELTSVYDIRELLVQTQNMQLDAIQNQTLNTKQINAFLQSNGSDLTELSQLVDTCLCLENIQNADSIPDKMFALVLKAKRSSKGLTLTFEFDIAHYSRQFIAHLAKIYFSLLNRIALNTDQVLKDISLCDEQAKLQILNEFNRAPSTFSDGVSVSQLVSDMARKTPDKVALQYNEQTITYAELERKATQIAEYMIKDRRLQFEERVAVMMDRSIACFTAMLGILKAGGAYVPVDCELSEERITTILDSAQVRTVLSESSKIKLLNNVQWQAKTFESFVCLDSEDVYGIEEAEQSELMSQQLWHYIGEKATNDIEGGGWYSSYDGGLIPQQEIDEYVDNTYQKLAPYLTKTSKVLEIGCATGFTMYRIAQEVCQYVGTDLSDVIIERNNQRIQKEGITNIKLAAMPAHEVINLDEDNFDIVIINSVIQDFHGHNYLRQVINNVITKLGDKGIIFIGDVMDQDRKQSMTNDFIEYKRAHPSKDVKTKIDWRAELFVSKDFFADLVHEFNDIVAVESDDKIHTIANEFTRFRFDSLLHVNKTHSAPVDQAKKKYQHDLSAVNKYTDSAFTSPYADKFDGHNLAYVIFTSGSTGVPKGAMIEHRGLINHAQAKIDDLGMDQNSVIAQNAALFFDISVWQYFAPLMLGATVKIYDNTLIFKPQEFMQRVMDDEISVLEVVPSYLSVLKGVLSETKAELKHLKYLMVTGEVIKPTAVNEWLELYPNIPVVNAYGPTEASDDITHGIIAQKVISERVTIGKPVNNMQVTIVDENMNLCPVGVKGEICVSGVGVGRGYINDRQKTALAFIAATGKHPRLYKTGDVGAWNQDGSIDFFGRNDYQIKIRGFRIELGDIESAIRRFSGVTDVCVITEGHEENLQLVACVCYNAEQVEAGSEETFNEHLKRFLMQELPDYMHPSRVHHFDKLSLSANGKVDRKALSKLAAQKNRGVIIEPEEELEFHLREVWADVLEMNINEIGITEDFFDIGGNSVTVLKLVNRISSELGIHTTINTIFEHRTIQQLGQEMQQEREVIEGLRCTIKLNNSQSKNNLFLIHAGDGTIFAYRTLAKLLEPTHTVYGIQARGLTDKSVLPESLPEVIGEYLNEMFKVQPDGPYLIGGLCTGTHIAFDMARALENLGKEVQELLLLDIPVEWPEPLIKKMTKASKRHKPGNWANKIEMARDKVMYYMKDENINRAQRTDDEQVEFKDWKATVYKHMSHLLSYKSKSFRLLDTPITVLSAIGNPEALKTQEDWQRMTTEKVTFIEVPGDHDSMFYPPHVQEVHRLMDPEQYIDGRWKQKWRNKL